MDRRDELDRRAEILTKQLRAWARDINLLQPGEQLVFSLRINRNPTVIRDADDAVSVLDLRIEDFFSKERLAQMTSSRALATRARSVLLGEISHGTFGEKAGLESMREFIEKIDEIDLLKIPNLGQKTLMLILETLASAGLHLRS